MATAVKAYGAIFDGSSVKRDSWGLRHRADQTLILEAFQDLREFPSSLHLVANKIGSCRVRLNGALPNMRLGWIMRFLFQSMRQLTPFRPLSGDEDFDGGSSSESEMATSPATKKSKSEELIQGTGEKKI